MLANIISLSFLLYIYVYMLSTKHKKYYVGHSVVFGNDNSFDITIFLYHKQLQLHIVLQYQHSSLVSVRKSRICIKNNHTFYKYIVTFFTKKTHFKTQEYAKITNVYLLVIYLK